MTTRVRYVNNNGVLVSKPLVHENATFLVQLRTDELNGEVLRDGVVIGEFTGNSLAELKKLAKHTLSGLGLQFGKETRKRVKLEQLAS